MSDTITDSTVFYRELVHNLLAKSTELKGSHGVEPPITEANLGDLVVRAHLTNGDNLADSAKQPNYAAVETAFREKFYELLVFERGPCPLVLHLRLTPITGFNIDRRTCFCQHLEFT